MCITYRIAFYSLVVKNLQNRTTFCHAPCSLPPYSAEVGLLFIIEASSVASQQEVTIESARWSAASHGTSQSRDLRHLSPSGTAAAAGGAAAAAAAAASAAARCALAASRAAAAAAPTTRPKILSATSTGVEQPRYCFELSNHNTHTHTHTLMLYNRSHTSATKASRNRFAIPAPGGYVSLCLLRKTQLIFTRYGGKPAHGPKKKIWLDLGGSPAQLP